METRDVTVPGFWARYRFYTRARIPEGHEEWARRRASFGSFLGALLLIEACVWCLMAAFVIAATGGFGGLEGVLWIAAFFALVALYSAAHYCAKARRRLGL